MKKILPILILLFCTYLSSAQNWKPVTPGVKHYFTNVDGYLKGMDIDSILAYGNDLHYYPYLRVHFDSYGISGFGSFGADTIGSWLGRDIIMKPGGTFLFPNHWNDTIVIKTRAMPGDSWVFYQRSPDKYYQAEVTSAGVMNVLGVPDSVKTIKLRAYENGNINTADSFDNTEIVLSKDHGFQAIMELYYFPFYEPDTNVVVNDYYFINSTRTHDANLGVIPIPGRYHCIFHLFEFHDLSPSQFIDWSVGDVYEYDACFIGVFTGYDQCDPPYRYRLDTIISKMVTNAGVEYIRRGWTAHPVFNNNSTLSHYELLPVQDTIFYSNTGSYLDIGIPEKWDGNLTWIEKDLNYYFSNDTNCFISPALYSLSYQGGLGSNGNSVVQKQGIGLFVSDMWSVSDYPLYGHNNLIYSMRNGNACGTYLFPDTSAPVVNGIAELNEASFKIFPNPAHDEVSIVTPASGYAVFLINNIGQVVYIKQQCTGKLLVDTRHFADGIYIMKLQTTDGHTVNRKLVVQH